MPPYTERWAVRPQGRLLSRCICFWLLCFLPLDSAFAGDSLLLCLENGDGKVLYSEPMQNGSIFAIRYRHSVALSPVTDYFIVKNDGIWLEKTVYQDFGAGLPHAPEGGEIMSSGDGHITIGGFNRKLGSFQLRVGRVANHVLLIRRSKAGEEPDLLEIPLATMAGPGSAVTFAVRSVDQ